MSKKFSVDEFSAGTHRTQGTAQSVRWPCELLVLWIGHFEGPTEVQLNSWRKGASLSSRSSQRI